MNKEICKCLGVVYDIILIKEYSRWTRYDECHEEFSFQLCHITINNSFNKKLTCCINQYCIRNKNTSGPIRILIKEKEEFIRYLGDWLYTRNDLLILQNFIINNM